MVGGDDDDVAAAALDHDRRHRPTEQVGAARVGTDLGLEVVDRFVPRIERRRDADRAGVGDGDVDAAVVGDDLVDEGAHVLGLRHVARHIGTVADVAGDAHGAGVAQRRGPRRAEATGAARDDGDLPIERAAHLASRSVTVCFTATPSAPNRLTDHFTRRCRPVCRLGRIRARVVDVKDRCETNDGRRFRTDASKARRLGLSYDDSRRGIACTIRRRCRRG